MKQSIKNLGMATLVILGTILSSCEKLEPTQPEEHEDNIVVCTTTVSLDTEATKALTEHGEKTFAEGETIAVIYTNEDGETVKAVSDALPSGNYGNTASFIVSLTNPASDAAVRIIYPAAMAAKTVATERHHLIPGLGLFQAVVVVQIPSHTHHHRKIAVAELMQGGNTNGDRIILQSLAVAFRYFVAERRDIQIEPQAAGHRTRIPVKSVDLERILKVAVIDPGASLFQSL